MIDRKKVFKVYTGKPGCMCGCLGKYTCDPEMVDVNSKFDGYDTGVIQVSSRSVSIIVNKMNKLIKSLGITEEIEDCMDGSKVYLIRDDDCNIYSFDVGVRTTVVYELK